jgi:hypothetical protein
MAVDLAVPRLADPKRAHGGNVEALEGAWVSEKLEIVRTKDVSLG